MFFIILILLYSLLTNYLFFGYIFLFIFLNYLFFNIQSFTFKINLKIFKYLLFKNNNFFKESFYIDFLQKKMIDNFVKKTLIISSQLFNLNYFFLNNIKYIYSFILNNFYLIYKINDNSIYSVLVNIFFFFLLFFGFTLIYIILI